MTFLASPARFFRTVAVAEAVTWALLLTGMVLKYVTETTDLAVGVFGMLHGVVFIAYCLSAVVVGVDQRWSPARGGLGLLAAIPPFLTIWFDLATERRGLLDTSWRLRSEDPASLPERVVGRLVRHPARAVVGGGAAVAVLTAVALAVGPPV